MNATRNEGREVRDRGTPRRGARAEPHAAPAAPAFAPSQQEVATALLPATRRMHACLSLAVAIAQDESGVELGDFLRVFAEFERHYATAIRARDGLHAAIPTAGRA